MSWITNDMDTFTKIIDVMNEIKDKHPDDFKVEVLSDSISSIYPELKDTLR